MANSYFQISSVAKTLSGKRVMFYSVKCKNKEDIQNMISYVASMNNIGSTTAVIEPCSKMDYTFASYDQKYLGKDLRNSSIIL